MKNKVYTLTLLALVTVLLVHCTVGAGGPGDSRPTEQAATPQFSPQGGSYDADIDVAISCATSGAVVRYTTDGSDPDDASPTYTGPVAVAGDGTTMSIKAIAFADGYLASSIADADFTIDYNKVATPNFTPAGGTYATDSTVDITCSTAGATIHYTIDGSDPTTSDAVFGSAILVAGHTTSMTIKALAVKAAMNESDIASHAYTIDYTLAPPTEQAGGISFTDGDTDVGEISGDLAITKATDEAAITHYHLYWGDSTTSKLGGEPVIAQIAVTGSDVTHTFTADTAIPAGATHFLVYTANGSGEGATPVNLVVTDVSDSVAPTPGDSGTITQVSYAGTSIDIEWTRGTDNVTAQGDLLYKVVVSENPDIDTVSNAESNGTVKLDWTTDATSDTISGLTGGTGYYINVLVRDEAGLVSAYTMTSNDGSGFEDTSWEKFFDGDSPNRYDVANDAAFDSNGNLYIVGAESNTSNIQYWKLRKFNSSGIEDDTNWDFTFNGSGGHSQPYGVAVDSNNNVYVVGSGYRLMSTVSKSDWWLKKFQSDGTEITSGWDKQYDAGKEGSDIAYDVVIDSNDHIYVVGMSTGYYSYNSHTGWYIRKFQTNGSEITTGWGKRAWNTSHSGNGARAACVDSNDNLIVVGQYDRNWAILKFSSDGTQQFAKYITSSDTDSAYSVAVDSTDEIYVVGKRSNDWWLKKYDTAGNEIAGWNKIVDGNGGYDVAYSIIIDSKDNIYIGGIAYNMIDLDSQADIWIKRYDVDGNPYPLNWDIVENTGASSYDQLNSLVLDSNEDIFMIGRGKNLYGASSGDDWWIKKYSGADF
jgi:hypothetical protein